MARPTKAQDARRIYTIRVRVSFGEKEQINDAADNSGLTVSDYMRGKAIDSAPRTKKATPERAAFIRGLAELGKVGSNLNQIARALNRRDLTQHGSEVPAEHISNALHGIDTLSHHLIQLLEHGH